MKNRVFLGIVTIVIVLVLSACGSEASDTERNTEEAVRSMAEETSVTLPALQFDKESSNEAITESAEQSTEETTLIEETVAQAEEETTVPIMETSQENNTTIDQEEIGQKVEKSVQEGISKALEESQKKAEEEGRRRKEEEESKQAEEKKKIEEEKARKKAEEEETARNSFAMMNLLAVTAENIRTAKDNRLILNDIYTSLLNDINPDKVDELTQTHLKNLRDIIDRYQDISIKRERLQYLYNQEKAAAIRSAVPNPLAILSLTNALDWKKLALNVAYSAIDSYTRYKNASDSADKNFLTNGWELDDEERDAIRINRDNAFDYMVDMVQEYKLDGKLTLNEKAVEKFSEICAIESTVEKIRSLVDEEATYYQLGNYWLELADCYFQTSQYKKCLESIDRYNKLPKGIYRKDYNYVKVLPGAIVAAQNVYTGDEYVAKIKEFADAIVENTSTDEWSVRYFAAEVYLDLYAKTGKREFIEKAYDIIDKNVTKLISKQRELNSTYRNDIVEVVAEKPDYTYLSAEEKKEKEKEYKAEQKRVKEYNKGLKETRKTELPSLYEPFVLNCEMLFALADKVNLSSEEKKELDDLLQTTNAGIFLAKPVNQAYSFNKKAEDYDVEVSTDEIIVPVNLLTSGSVISVTVNENGLSEVFDDCKITKVERKGKTIDSFFAHVSSEKLKKHHWTKDSKVEIKITYSDAYDKSVTIKYHVSDYQKRWFGDKVVFAKG